MDTTIQLRDGQDGLVQQMFESLNGPDRFFLNTSGTGSGKTITTSYAAALAGYSLWVVSPASCRTIWKDMKQLVHLQHVMSYDQLRGTGTTQPKHGYLRRVYILNANNTISIRFEPTAKLTQLTQNKRILLVLDECHKTKNDSLQARACATLTQHFLTHGKVALLSATPFDQIKHIINLFRLLGILTHSSLCTRSGNASGFMQVVDFCRSIDTKTTATCIPFELNKKTTSEACLHLWSQVIAPHHVFAMSQKDMFREFGEYKNIKNLHCPIDTDEFQTAIRALQSAFVTIQEENGRLGKNYSRINHALMLLEAAKVPTLIQLIKHDLFFYPTCKVIVFCSYRSTIRQLCEAFQSFRPLRFEGKMSEEDSERSKRLFQSESLEYRLFFANLSKGELGISLHDMYGARQRRMYIIPTYKNPHQVVGRVYRTGLRSNPYVRFLYGREQTETKILTKLANMKPVMIHTLPQQKQDKMVFPGEYPTQRGMELSPEWKEKLNTRIESVLWCDMIRQQYLVAAWDHQNYKQPIYLWINKETMEQDCVYTALIAKISSWLPSKEQARLQNRLHMVQNEFYSLFPRGIDTIVLDYYDLDCFWYFFSREHPYGHSHK